jgi:RND family efflux transporter MFP subunit
MHFQLRILINLLRCRSLSIYLCVVLSSLLAMYGCRSNDTSKPDEKPAETSLPKVRTQVVERWEPPALQAFSGVVRPHKRALLSTRTSGTLTHVLVAAGDNVKAGTLLARVDSRDIVAALDAARSQEQAAQSAYAKAELDVQRLERLYADDLIARNRLERARVERDNTKAALSRARTQVRLQQANLDYARIRAPFNGVVSEVPVDQGSFVGPGTTLLILEDRSSLRIDAPVSASAAARIRESTNPEFLIESPSLKQPMKASFQEIIPALENNGVGRFLRVRVESPDVTVSPGEIVKIVLKTPHPPAATPEYTSSTYPVTTIPASALIRQGQLTSVMVAEPAGEKQNVCTLHRRWIVTAVSDPGYPAAEAHDSDRMVKVIQGLDPGEMVVTNPAPELSDKGRAILVSEDD